MSACSVCQVRVSTCCCRVKGFRLLTGCTVQHCPCATPGAGHSAPCIPVSYPMLAYVSGTGPYWWSAQHRTTPTPAILACCAAPRLWKHGGPWARQAGGALCSCSAANGCVAGRQCAVQLQCCTGASTGEPRAGCTATVWGLGALLAWLLLCW